MTFFKYRISRSFSQKIRTRVSFYGRERERLHLRVIEEPLHGQDDGTVEDVIGRQSFIGPIVVVDQLLFKTRFVVIDLTGRKVDPKKGNKISRFKTNFLKVPPEHLPSLKKTA